MMNLPKIQRQLRAFLLLGVLMAGGASAQTASQDQVQGALKGVSTLSLYTAAYDAKPVDSVAVKDVHFPLDILAVDGDFLQVRWSGKAVWLDGAQVSVSKPVPYDCVKVARKPTKTAAIQGASTGCQ